MKKIVAPFLRTPYNYDTNQASDETGIDCSTNDPNQACQGAKQSFKDEVDINTILKRFGLGYEMPANPRMPMQGDFTGMTDYRTAVTRIVETQQMFEEYPAHIRAKFDNDPAKFVDFCLDEKNRPEMAEMGLLSKEALGRLQEAAEQSKTKGKGEGSKPDEKGSKPDKTGEK